MPYFGDGQNIIPTIHVKDLAKIVKQIIEKKPENKYIIAIDETKDRTLKNIISSISTKIGSGKTKSIEDKKDNPLKFSTQDHFIDSKVLETPKTLKLLITNNEFNWHSFLNNDIMLQPSKFIEEDFPWHCKEGIPANAKKLLKEFCQFRKLRPLKIVLNCANKDVRTKFANKLSKFFNIPKINHDRVIDLLNIDVDELNEEELFMKQKYLELKEKLANVELPEEDRDDDYLNYDEIMYTAFKYCMKENECENRGYVIEGFPSIMTEVEFIHHNKVEIKPEGEEENEEDQEHEIELKEENNQENKEEIHDEENEEHEENELDQKDVDIDNKPQEEIQKVVPKKKKKPKKFKKVFDKTMLPESVISILMSKSI